MEATLESDRLLRDDVALLRNDLVKIKEDLRTMADTLLNRTRHSAQAIKDNVGAKMETSLHAVEHRIEERPLTAVLVAFGVGLVVGKLFIHK